MFKTPKYHNKKTEIDGISFASKKEAKRYTELKLLERAGLIKNLELQKKFVFEGLAYDSGRKVSYLADFVYIDEKGVKVVEDAKGMKTDVYKLKKALMRHFFNIEIREV